MFSRTRNILLMLLCLLSSQAAATTNLVSFESHDISIKLNIADRTATIADKASVTLYEGFNLLYLHEKAVVDNLTIDGVMQDYSLFDGSDTSAIEKYIGESLPAIELESSPKILAFKTVKAGQATLNLKYSSVFDQDVSKMRFSRETVGGEVTGTIGEQGAYLSPASYYYPQGQESQAMFDLMVELPEGWEAISDGNPAAIQLDADLNVRRFYNPFLSGGNMFMAAPWVVGRDSVNGIEVACYFFTEDSSLIPGYLESTVGYISMYSDLIGPYPFERFVVAENFFPTGYGMPAWTLLGQQVIQLPFIKATSLGHEVLHNWWGNSVDVDYERGNWCESATVYGADYRYKLLQSPEAAKAYRKNILKEYVSYVSEENDFPIREFTGRTSANTRTIGYNKAMMVWHMLEEQIGSEPFWQAWKNVFAKYVGEKISWEEWIAALEETRGRDLSNFIPEWIDRAGAPEIAVEFIGIQRNTASDSHFESWVKFDIKQNPDEIYRMHIPVKYIDQSGIHDTVLVLGVASQRFRLPATEIKQIEIDPDYHIFRKLYPEEVEPIVSGVLGNPAHLLVCDSDDAALRQAFNEFGNNIVGDSLPLLTAVDQQAAATEISPVVVNPETLPEYYNDILEVTADSIRVMDSWYPTEGHTFVLSGNNWGNAEKFMVVLTSDPASLPRLGQLVPHYGKYSYLVFEGSHNVGKGQWPVTSSPLKLSF